MFKDSYPLYLGNIPSDAPIKTEVFDKYSGKLLTRVSTASEEMIYRAISLAVDAQEEMKALPAYERQTILSQCVDAFKMRKEEFAKTVCLEGGKPIRDARAEVDRLIDTFRIAAEESTRLKGEYLPLDISERAKNYSATWKRVPIGPCSFISPFNFPLNLVAHKIAPAIAVGCPFILKPATRTPVSALLIGEVLSQTSLPKGSFSILPCERKGAELFTTDERLKLLSFTGSPDVGWELKAKAGKKKVVLELGGNAACIVDETADLQDAVNRILVGAFSNSGQSCISVQRIFVHQTRYETFKSLFVEAAKKLKVGNPSEEATVIGPMISESEAARLEKWVQSALEKGAKLLCGGKRQGPVFEGTVLENVPQAEKLSCEEAFGPVAILIPFETFEEALERANESRFGLQAGIFTRDLYRAQKAWDTLDVGGVIIGDIPSWRVDHMPYGGVKDSGLGREGVRFAMEEMTEIRLMVLRTPA